ncbi:unnamed protein product [Miscanthus lutarioriparius]|uniref:Disease resistance protein RGA3 n=1 Tax=Miscanthus lutarioriparius TaxID=422564 RepID=A0A811R4D5_9POAL|nr:unnamed protein product [Miscanthus lutarioriparius]
MADLLLLPVVTRVTGKATDELVQSITRMWGIDTDRGKLERLLLAVQCMLPDAEVKGETSPVVRRWMKELKGIAYQAEDVLDDLQYEALRREANEGEPMARKVSSYLTLHSPLLFRLTVSRNLSKVLKKLDDLVLEMHTLGLVERLVAQHALCQQTQVVLDGSAEIFGRDDDKEVVVKLLLDQQHQGQKNVQVLPIIGMGGVGKTTLAKMVYKDHRIDKQFGLKIWHCVTENFEAISVVRSIIESATGERCDLPDDSTFWRAQLQGAIGRKRFLLILDNVWNEEQDKWEDELKPLLCTSIGGSGSMIVVTSRNQQVAAIMGTLPTQELACLTEDDSWDLFSKKAFSKGVQEQPELVTIGRRIVHMCKGLPLALNTMGGLMSSKQEVQDWEAIAESYNSDTSRGTDEVLSILKLSYRHLPKEMKQCFAFCAVFPKDYEMEKDKLIQLWMANGYIREGGTMDLAQKSEFVFSELVWRSFLQDVKAKIFCNTLHETIICKMHDLMHDLAKDVSDECASAEELIQGKASIKDIYHMQVSRHELNEINGLLKGRSSLHTLLTQSAHNHLELKLKSVRSLCCEGLSVIHGQLISTAHLRLRYLPDGMTTMRKISYIHLLECDSLERMPPKLGLLQNLRTLTTFIVDTGDDLGIEELKDLQYLGNRLELFNLNKVKSGSKVNFHEKQNLSELLLYWGRDRDYDPLDNEEFNKDEEVLESLVPHGELKVLKLHGYGGLAMSQWMRDPKMFRCLRELVITECPRCKDLPIVWLSSSLEVLNLSEMISLTTLCKNIDVAEAGCNTSQQIFPKLRRMRLQYFPELERWAENSAGEPSTSVMFPMLEELKIYHCYKLVSFPESPVLTLLSCLGDSARGLVPVSMPLGSWPSLVHLGIGLLAEVVMPPEDLQSQNQRPLDTMRSLKILGEDDFVSIFNLSKSQLGFRDCLAFVEKLEIGSCPSIVHWPVEELRCLPCLRSLNIWYCKNLEGKGSSSEEILRLPQLEWLSIQHCESLLEIPKLPTSLEEMGIRCCNSLVALPSNLGNLAKLRHFSIEDCGEMKALPDGMVGLTSLERLSIEECPGIEKFPQGLLQRLPALKFLEIKACPDLQRRCRQGGEYFDLISSISSKDIPEVESNIKKFVKKLIPFC